ncbi:uncharacterized protein LOC119083488 [Bradysia coprophila]|uniref:uncharacterized protein LOC119083488 n=1 Tax=Bradysia coprophila TaxID=38358 RepID=UPI00187DBE38|nr:uncharacterized protein LOC119083488 [Bradysia coprophila]
MSKPSKMYATILFVTCIIGYVHTAPAPGQSDLNKLLDKASAATQSITLVNAPLLLIGEGPIPSIIKDCTAMVTVITTNLEKTKDAGLDFDKVCKLMNLLIGKAGMLQQVPFVFEPIRSVLASLEGVIDANILNKNVESQMKRHAEYSGCIDTAIRAYTSY